MTTRQEIKLTMMMVFRDFLVANTAITDLWPDYATSFAKLVNYIQQILGLANKQGMDIKGFAKAKARIRYDMTVKTMSLVGKMYAFAVNTENDVLKQRLSLTKSELDLLPDTLVGARCKEMTELAMSIKADADLYGVKGPLIGEIDDLIENYEASVPTPMTAIKDKKLVTAQTELLFEACETVLEKIDSFAEMVRYDVPTFYMGFQNSRKLDETSSSTRALIMQILDKVTGAPVAKATIILKHKYGTEMTKSVKKSGSHGIIYMNRGEAGEYEYEVIMNGYTVATGTFFINDGVTTKLEVLLERAVVA